MVVLRRGKLKSFPLSSFVIGQQSLRAVKVEFELPQHSSAISRESRRGLSVLDRRLSTALFCGIALVPVAASDSLAKPLEFGLIPYSRDISGAPEPTRAGYLARFPESDMTLFDVERSGRGGRLRRDEEGTVVVAVNHRLLGVHREGFDIYAADLEEEGYDVVLLDVQGGTPAELKQQVVEQGGDRLVGVLFAGELPLAWFEQYEYFDSEAEPDDARLHEYPIDLFYMDTDGDWQDTSGNGIYDLHGGAWEPDVWVGRIAAYNLFHINEDSLVAPYLERIHRYRQGELHLPHKALGYIDDDWQSVAPEWGSEIGLSFGNVFLEANPETTSAVGYRAHLSGEGYELVQVAVHSSTDTHDFLVEHRSRYDYFRFRHLRDNIEPHVFFYNLFACSVMNLDYNLCLGALYPLKSPDGLGAVGPAKKGGMLFYEDYYAPVGDGVSFGEALRRWMTLHAREPGHERWSQSWFYGMTHFGDPTLKLRLGPRVSEYAAEDDEGDNDGIPDAGELVGLRLVVVNRGQVPLNGVRATIASQDSTVEVVSSEIDLGDLPPGELVEGEGATLSLSRAAADRHIALLTVQMDPAEGQPWWDRVRLELRSPDLTPVRFEALELAGDNNGFVGPDEEGRLVVSFLNSGGDGLRNLADILIEPVGQAFLPVSRRSRLNAVEAGSNGVSEPITYRIAPDAPAEAGVFVRLSVEADGLRRGSGVIALPLSPGFQFASDLDADPGWIVHRPVTESFSDVWRWGADCGEGSGGIGFGGPDSAFYPAHADAVFELPLMQLSDNAALTIRHKMDAEEEYDGGVIEVDRGRGWERIAPDAGYNGRSVANGSFPGGPCWNGTFDWQGDRVGLGGPPGPVRIRLRFASDTGVEGLGWFIDQLAVSGTPLLTPPEPRPPTSLVLLNVHPNPFNSSAMIDFRAAAPARLRLYALDGRLAADWGEATMTGQVKRRLDGGRLAAGIYVLRLEGKGGTVALKVALVK